MTFNVSTYHSLLRLLRSNRFSYMLSARNIVNLHSTANYQIQTESCKLGNSQSCETHLRNDLLDSKIKSCCPSDGCYDNLECRPVKAVCNSPVMSSSRYLKQSAILIPHAINNFCSVRNTLSACSLLEQSSAFYHQSKHFATSNHNMLRTVNSQSHHCLLRQPSIIQTSQLSISSFSPTKLILESCPLSFQPYLRLIRFDKPIGSWLLYWPCTWSIALAAEPGCLPDLKMLALFGAGAFFMRGAGCIINDMWDKDLDSKVARTRLRPLAAGEITQFQALVFLGTQLSCALAILLQLNTYSIILGAASMGLVITYPLFKRFTYWPQLILGLTLNWGVLLAWSSLKGSVGLPGLTLYLICTIHTVIYDTIYSHQDKYDDMLIGIKSTAILLGDQTKPWLTFFAAIMTGGLTFSGYLCDMTWPYYLTAALTGTRLIQQIYTINLNDADECAQAFRGNFYLGAIMFAGIVVANLLKPKEEVQTEKEDLTTELITETELTKE